MPKLHRGLLAGEGRIDAGEMLDSSLLLKRHDWPALRKRLEVDGYVLLRGLLPTAEVDEARLC